ncbi:MAG: hypothetical protein ABIF87_10710 [Pseudomonadota bacterium]
MNIVIIKSDQGMDQCVVFGILLRKKTSSSQKFKGAVSPIGGFDIAGGDSFNGIRMSTLRTSS